MKKLFLLLVLLSSFGVAMAQNVIGAPVYYSDSTQYRPGHGTAYDSNPRLHRYGTKGFAKSENDFNKIFLEAKAMIGTLDATLGASLTYVPDDWGLYASCMWGVNYDWSSFGGVYRLSGPYSQYDWQLYGGLVFGPGIGGEAGVRVAFDNVLSSNDFSWWSLSMGVTAIQGYSFFTMGCSIGLTGCGVFGFIF